MRRLYRLSIPLTRPFATAAGGIEQRTVVLVAATEAGVTGWGEAAPYPGVTPDTAEGVWKSLTSGGALTPSAKAAVEEADTDRRARQAGVPLWATIGGSSRPVPTSVAVGLDGDAADQVQATGAAAVKVKIEPGAVDRVAAVRERLPDVVIGVDANGSFAWEQRNELLAMDGLDVAYVEQPFAADALEDHARLRDELVADVVVDEPIASVESAVAVIEAGAADVVAVKPGRIGLEACRVIHDLALAAGLRIKASGLVETAVGRAHTLAVATLPGAIHSDVADDAWYLGTATGTPPWQVFDGWITPSDDPGVGVVPDLEALAPYVEREALLDG